MYGKNNPSPKKRLIIEGLKMGKNFSDLAADLSITKATAEVYRIDGLVGSISTVSRVRSLILPEERHSGDECGLIFPNSGW